MAQEVGCFSQGGGNNSWSPCRSQFVLCELCRSPFNLLKVIPSDELEWNEPSVDIGNSSLSPRPGDYTGFIWVTLIFIFIWHCRQGISAKPLCCSQGTWIFEISISRNMKMFKKFNPRGTSEILKPWAQDPAQGLAQPDLPKPGCKTPQAFLHLAQDSPSASISGLKTENTLDLKAANRSCSSQWGCSGNRFLLC